VTNSLACVDLWANGLGIEG